MALKTWVKQALSGTSKSQESLNGIRERLSESGEAAERGTHTLVIPTYRRPRDLAALLHYFELAGLQSKLLILDSSPAEEQAQNAEVVASSSLDIELVVFPDDISPYVKMHQGLQRVATTFVSACADDDFIILQGLRHSLRQLIENEDAAAAHGEYVNFIEKPGRLDISFIDQREKQVLGKTALQRVKSLMAGYTVLFYSVQRTDFAKRCFSSAERFSTTLMSELGSGAALAIQGNVLRVETPYMGRSTAPSHSYHGWHPHQFICDRPALLFESYMDLREDLLNRIAEQDGPNEDASELLDTVFLGYLGPFLSTAEMELILHERIDKGSDSAATIEALWNRFASRERHMRRRVQLFPDDGHTFAPGVRGIHGPITDYAHTVTHDHGEVNLLFYNEFFAGVMNDQLLIGRNRTQMIIDAATLYCATRSGQAPRLPMPASADEQEAEAPEARDAAKTA